MCDYKRNRMMSDQAFGVMQCRPFQFKCNLAGKMITGKDFRTMRVTEIVVKMMMIHMLCLARQAVSVDSFWQARSRDIRGDKAWIM